MRLPQFTIQSIVDTECVGTVEPSKWVAEGWVVALRAGDRFIWGRFVQVDDAARAVRVRIDDAAHMVALEAGESYPFIDGYWADKAELVLDEARTWRRTTFQPVDAVRNIVDGHRIETRADTGQEGELVPGGWDHEHCEVCGQEIGTGGVPGGWTSDKGEWLCEGCHENYVVPRSIEFVNVE